MIEINKWALNLAQDLGNKYNLRSSEIYLGILEFLNEKILDEKSIKQIIELICIIARDLKISFRESMIEFAIHINNENV